MRPGIRDGGGRGDGGKGGLFLHKGPERPWYEAVKEKPGLEWKQPKREELIAIRKAAKAEPAEPFDIRCGAAGLGVCPAGL